MRHFSFTVSPTYRSAAAISKSDREWAGDHDAQAVGKILEILSLATMILSALWAAEQPGLVRELATVIDLVVRFLAG